MTYLVGVDFGTLSGRAVVVRAADGTVLGSAVSPYRHAVLERELPDRSMGGPAQALPPDWALQVPGDYVEVLRQAVPAALASSSVPSQEVVGIAIDFTACTVLPTLADGTPLCDLPALAARPHAYVKLWKHHAAQGQANRINAVAAERGEPWLARYGGRISSEWQFAKALQVFEEDPEVYRAADRWIEAADWIVWQLCGRETRNECTAGYKGIWQDGRFPDPQFLEALAPGFGSFARDKLVGPMLPLGARAGSLTPEAAAWTGLPAGIAVAAGTVDAHVTAPAAQAVAPGQLLLVMGTSTCHVLNGESLAEVPGMCGVVRGGITPGLWGYEAGQSGVGDIFGWFVDNAVPERYRRQAQAEGVDLHELLSRLGAEQPVGAHGLVALDWHNGNRSLLVDHELSGLLLGLTTSTRPEEIYRALQEATAFGTRAIIEAFEERGVPVHELVVAGGLTRNAVLLQIYADVTGRPLSLLDTEHGPALGAAMHAALAAGLYPDIGTASAAMGRRVPAAHTPDPERRAAYDALYAEYRLLHDHFGRGANDVMHRLRALRRAAAAAHPGARPGSDREQVR